jgi:anti-sigma factor RsiW
MSGMICEEMQLLIQAELDGELPAAEIARLQAHLNGCASCTAKQRRLQDLSAQLRSSGLDFAAPAMLRASLMRDQKTRMRRRTWHSWAGPGAWFGIDAALAACLMLAVLPGTGESLPDAVVAAHIRALQPGHLIDVLSTDKHTVRPWFDGKLPFAPPVKDLSAAGFPLYGGRLDYVDGHIAAGLIYRAGPHMINLFVWPSTHVGIDRTGVRDGYNFVRWNADGMAFWAVSDLNAAELASFVRQWRAG